MDFVLFLLVNALLFIRPAEIVPELDGAPLYFCATLACAVAATPKLRRQVSSGRLRARPIVVCVLALLPAALLSHAVAGHMGQVRQALAELAKLAAYLVVLVAVLDTPSRVHRFVGWLVGFIGVLTVLALLQYGGYVQFTGLSPVEERTLDGSTGAAVIDRRLCSTGIFHDPNDLALILVAGIGLGFYRWDVRRGLNRWLWALPVGLFACALILTGSRGGLIALVAGLAAYAYDRWGWRRALGFMAVMAPPIALLGAGRLANLDLSEGTAQDRIRLWSQGLAAFRQSPIFGIGYGSFVDEFGLVTHNSYLTCFTELGLLGGTLFLGAVYFALRSLAVGQDSDPASQPGLRPYLFAIVVAYATGILFLSRAYTVPTYLILGLAAAWQRCATADRPVPALRLSFATLQRLALVSAGFLASTYVFVRLFVRWA